MLFSEVSSHERRGSVIFRLLVLRSSLGYTSVRTRVDFSLLLLRANL